MGPRSAGPDCPLRGACARRARPDALAWCDRPAPEGHGAIRRVVQGRAAGLPRAPDGGGDGWLPGRPGAAAPARLVEHAAETEARHRGAPDRAGTESACVATAP